MRVELSEVSHGDFARKDQKGEVGHWLRCSGHTEGGKKVKAVMFGKTAMAFLAKAREILGAEPGNEAVADLAVELDGEWSDLQPRKENGRPVQDANGNTVFERVFRVKSFKMMPATQLVLKTRASEILAAAETMVTNGHPEEALTHVMDFLSEMAGVPEQVAKKAADVASEAKPEPASTDDAPQAAAEKTAASPQPEEQGFGLTSEGAGKTQAPIQTSAQAPQVEADAGFGLVQSADPAPEKPAAPASADEAKASVEELGDIEFAAPPRKEGEEPDPFDDKAHEVADAATVAAAASMSDTADGAGKPAPSTKQASGGGFGGFDGFGS